MTACRIVQELGVVTLWMMIAVSVVEIILPVLTVPVYLTVLLMKMNVVFVMMMPPMTVCRTVPVSGVVRLS